MFEELYSDDTLKKCAGKNHGYFQRMGQAPVISRTRGVCKNHTKRTRGKKLVSRPPLVVMRPVAPYIALYRIARQINACIPTLSAPAAWLPWFLRDVIPRRRKLTNAREKERKKKKRKIWTGGKSGERERDGTSFTRVHCTQSHVHFPRAYMCAWPMHHLDSLGISCQEIRLGATATSIGWRRNDHVDMASRAVHARGNNTIARRWFITHLHYVDLRGS